MSAAAKFTQADVKRAVKGALDAGLRIGGVEIDANGKIVVLAAQGSASKPRGTGWDRVLGNDKA